jgi:hypothetical protein
MLWRRHVGTCAELSLEQKPAEIQGILSPAARKWMPKSSFSWHHAGHE